MVEVSEVSFVCPICGESKFSTKSIFLRHLKIHEVLPKKFTAVTRKFCDICGKMFPNKLVYNDHVRKYHFKEYPCNQCQNKYSSPFQLQRHMRIHTNDKYFCDKCNKTFTRFDNLQRHECKSPILEVECDQCLKVYTNERQLSQHMTNYHEIDDERHICEICSEDFGNSFQYKKHKKSKHIEFKYQCNKCNSQFTQKYSLTKHMKLYHNNTNTNPLINMWI